MPSGSRRSPGRKAQARQPASPRLAAALTVAKFPEDDLKDNGIYLSLEYADADLAGRDVASVEVDQCRYTNVKFAQTELDRGLISDSVFERCDLANLRARECALLRVAVSASRLTGMSWAEGSVREVTFDSCRMDMASFRFSALKGVVFTGCKLQDADFQEADLRTARFENCDLTGAQFSSAQMEGTRFAGCDLAGLNGVTSLKGAIIRSRDAMALTYSLAGALGIRIEDD
ncbi:MAG TPA: pentapeptide repeat-containing protein [Streptosporangiaceae bacterium]|nr:pentapeptide repeat-containing protein [Streptosporangiaceae bacterium]